MPQESKGDFVDFVKDASADLNLLQRFQNVLYQQGINEGNLSKFFLDEHYYEVSLKDCATLLGIARNRPDLVQAKY